MHSSRGRGGEVAVLTVASRDTRTTSEGVACLPRLRWLPLLLLLLLLLLMSLLKDALRDERRT